MTTAVERVRIALLEDSREVRRLFLEFERLDLLEDRIDVLICGGDFVGYGRQPQECMEAFEDYPLPKYMCLGNHEHRIDRAVNASAELDGTIGIFDLKYKEFG